MALKRPLKKTEEEGPNDHLGEEPIDAPVGYAPRVVKVPMNQNADVNPKVHEAKMEDKKARASSTSKVTLKQGAGKETKKSTSGGHMNSALSVTLLKAAQKGPGSRGGKVVRHTKSGKPVYESQAKKHAESSDKMMQSWHKNASQSGDPEHHAIAAKQSLHAAYYHHHAGDEVASHQAMDYANHHRAAYEKKGHKSRTTTAVEKLHHTTAHEVGHAGWEPGEHRLSHEHSVAQDARMQGDKKTAKKIHDSSPERQTAKLGDPINRTGARSLAIHGPSSEHVEEAAKSHSSEKSRQLAADHVNAHSHFTPEEHHEAANAHEKARDYNSKEPGWGNIGEAMTRAHRQIAAGHRAAAGKPAEGGFQKEHHDIASRLKKSVTPSTGGNNMSKNEVSDLFKSELGDNASKHLTNCVHCKHPLSREDLKKGLSHHFVADDNDNPHDGADNKPNAETPVRGVPGAKEIDEIAPLLKGLKGADAGEKEEFPIHKSEMLTMGMNADDLDDGWYTITKGEMQKQAPEHLAYLADRKTRVAKGLKPNVNTLKKGENSTRSTTDGPHGYSPRAGGVHGPNNESLVEWSDGSDKAVASYIEKSGGYGPGTDESIRTQGRGY